MSPFAVVCIYLHVLTNVALNIHFQKIVLGKIYG